MPSMPSEWNLHYARWVIDDGEPDRDVGESFRWFATEFWSEVALVLAKGAHEISATPVADFQYCVTAKVAYVSARAAVIDFGLTAIGPRDLLPPECREETISPGTFASVYLFAPSLSQKTFFKHSNALGT